MLKVNDIEIKAKEFAWDGCHKIYLIESDEDQDEAIEIGYSLYPIRKLQETYEDSCSLRFISSWRLSTVVGQFEEATFEGFK